MSVCVRVCLDTAKHDHWIEINCKYIAFGVCEMVAGLPLCNALHSLNLNTFAHTYSGGKRGTEKRPFPTNCLLKRPEHNKIIDVNVEWRWTEITKLSFIRL